MPLFKISSSVNGHYICNRFAGQEQYLHSDGTWHLSPRSPFGGDCWPGYFATTTAAIAACDIAEPQRQIPMRLNPVCRKCNHIIDGEAAEHVCPSQEYLDTTRRLIAAAAEFFERGGTLD